MTLPNRDLLRVDEVAEHLGVTKKTIYAWISVGILEAKKVNTRIRIPRETVLKMPKSTME
jgi:excisionase family DNA binding protein